MAIACVFQPERILSAASAPDLLYWVSYTLDAGYKDLAIDLRHVLFMDSSGLGALVIALNRVKRNQGRLALCSLTGQARILFETADMGQVFEVYANLQEFELTLLHRHASEGESLAIA